MARTYNTTPIISRSPIAPSSVSGPGVYAGYQARSPANEQQQQPSLNDAMDAYKIYNQFSGNSPTSGMMSGKGGGLDASGGGSGLEFMGGAPAGGVSGGLNASGGASGLEFMGGAPAAGGGGAGKGAMASAAGPIGLFAAGMALAKSEEAKHDKHLAKFRAELGPEELERRNAAARVKTAEQQQREAEEAEKMRKLQESDSE